MRRARCVACTASRVKPRDLRSIVITRGYGIFAVVRFAVIRIGRNDIHERVNEMSAHRTFLALSTLLLPILLLTGCSSDAGGDHPRGDSAMTSGASGAAGTETTTGTSGTRDTKPASPSNGSGAAGASGSEHANGSSSESHGSADTAGGKVPSDVNMNETGAEGVEGALGVVRDYYDAIAKKDYERAYHYWERNGLASGQTFAQFKAGFAETRAVSVVPGTPGRIEPAAGSRYVMIPVTINATKKNGTPQHFVGSYVLHRAVVDGAGEMKNWHIYAADIKVK